jgi:hypothetical protein
VGQSYGEENTSFDLSCQNKSPNNKVQHVSEVEKLNVFLNRSKSNQRRNQGNSCVRRNYQEDKSNERLRINTVSTINLESQPSFNNVAKPVQKRPGSGN